MKYFISLILATALLNCSPKAKQTSNKIEKDFIEQLLNQ